MVDKPHPTSLAVPNHVEADDEKSAVASLPLPQQLQTRTRDISKTTLSTQAEVLGLREDVRMYVERDLSEHAEIRERINSVDGRMSQMNEHIGGLREHTATMNGNLALLARDAGRREIDETAKKTEATATRDHRRHFVVAAISLLAAILGFLAHAVFGH